MPLQLAFALLLRECLPGLLRPAQVFDPAFEGVDVALLRRLDMHVMEENEGGQRLAHVPTLFYMPHCEVRRVEAAHVVFCLPHREVRREASQSC
eukprot:365361-Chlamydomonas_euryale.AAC.7